MKKWILSIIASLFVVGVNAQESAATKSFMDDPVNHPMLPVYIIGAFIIVVILLIMVVALYMINVLNMLTEQAAREKAEKAGKPYVAPRSVWSRWMEVLNRSVPVEQEKNIELDHSYDGIRELDNHLPPWWKWLFYGTIVWAVVYIIVFHVTDMLPLSEAEYEKEVAVAEEQARKLQASKPKATIDLETLEFTNDAAMIENGKTIFANFNCASCHRPDGGGNSIGPNLTDEYWIHGGAAKNIYTTVRDGAVEKGMPAWGKSMSATDVRDVAFFVMSLQGSNPPDAKAPQGDLFKQTVKQQTDSVKAQASL